uniref:Uncharacterized protein n=1 Tax=Glossina austeni TaxID=7395 RepID=A0A1A9VDX9_GLOAU
MKSDVMYVYVHLFSNDKLATDVKISFLNIWDEKEKTRFYKRITLCPQFHYSFGSYIVVYLIPKLTTSHRPKTPYWFISSGYGLSTMLIITSMTNFCDFMPPKVSGGEKQKQISKNN